MIMKIVPILTLMVKSCKMTKIMRIMTAAMVIMIITMKMTRIMIIKPMTIAIIMLEMSAS